MQQIIRLITITLICFDYQIKLIDSHGLTTFGKTSTNYNQNSVVASSSPIPAIARDCLKESDCSSVRGTTCVPNPKNNRKQCLCGDNKAPINGNCNAKYKGLRHSCDHDNDCLIGTECILSNSSQRFAGYPTKTCQCSDGYREMNFVCNSSPSSFRSTIFSQIFLIFISFTLIYVCKFEH